MDATYFNQGLDARLHDKSAMGWGWTMHMGRIFEQDQTFEGAPGLYFVTPDGAMHRLKDYEGDNVKITTDSTYMRATYNDVDDYWTVETRDGIKYTLKHKIECKSPDCYVYDDSEDENWDGYYTTSIEDQSGNIIRVEYDETITYESHLVRVKIVDSNSSEGREVIRISYDDPFPGDGLFWRCIQRIECLGYDDEWIQYNFAYEKITSNCINMIFDGSESINLFEDAYVLVAASLPKPQGTSGLSPGFTYSYEFMGGQNPYGIITQMDYPTGSFVEYGIAEYATPQCYCQYVGGGGNGPTGHFRDGIPFEVGKSEEHSSDEISVAGEAQTKDVDECEGMYSQWAEVWVHKQYINSKTLHYYDRDGVLQEPEWQYDINCSFTGTPDLTTVIDPDGNETKYYFEATTWYNADYNCVAPRYRFNSNDTLNTKIEYYKKLGPASDKLIRTVEMEYTIDNPNQEHQGPINPRMNYKKTTYDDFPDSTKPYAEVTYGGWETNTYHYWTETHHGYGFDIGTDNNYHREIYTVYSQNAVHLNKWLLNLVTERTLKSGSPFKNDHVVSYTYDNKGRLIEEYIKKYPEGSASSNDCQYIYTIENSTGNVTRKESRGGDTNLHGGWDRTYYQFFEYQYGQVSRAWYVDDPGISTAEAGYNVNRIVDASGLVGSEFDSSGALRTNYDYDEMGRMTQIDPPGNDSITDIHYSTSMDPLVVTVTRDCEDQEMKSEYHYDNMGRMQWEAQRAPVSTGWRARAVNYDHSGKKLYTTQWFTVNDDGNGNPQNPPGNEPRIEYIYGYGTDVQPWGYDPFGRVLEEKSVVPSGTETLIKQYGYAALCTKVWSNFDTSRPLRTDYYRDIFGRLDWVRQYGILGADPGDYETHYEYNALDNLLNVTQKISGQTPMERHFTYDGSGRMITSQEPETGYRIKEYRYNALGQQISMKDASAGGEGFWHAWLYDEAGRVVESRCKAAPLGSWVLKGKWVYDLNGDYSGGDSSLGKLCIERSYDADVTGEGIDWVCTRKYKYQPAYLGGRIAQVYIWFDELHGGENPALYPPFQMDYQYNEVGQVFKLGYPRIKYTSPGFPVVQYEHDYGLVHKINYSDGYPIPPGNQMVEESGITYNPAGGMKVIPAINGIKTVITYDGRNRPERVEIGKNGDPRSFYHSGLYEYDSSGDLTSRGPDDFQYDELSRLTYAEINGQNNYYSYDRYGNILSRQGPSGAFNRQYNDKNQLYGANISYDERGNLTKWMFEDYAYDADNRMVEYENAAGTHFTYGYSVDGKRVYKKEIQEDDGTITTYFLRGLGGEILTEWTRVALAGGRIFSKRVKDFVHLNGENFAMLKPAGGGGFNIFYYHNDHLGSPLELTNDETPVGSRVEKYRYFPYGGIDETRSIEAINTHKFTGKERDKESGLDYFEARYYGNSFCRFMSCDKIIGKTQNPQSWNRYTYVLNNPLRLTDPQGLTVQVNDDLALVRIQSTLPKDLRDKIILDSSGNISREAVKAIQSNDANFLALKKLVMADAVLEVSTGPSATINGKTWEFYSDSEAELMQDYTQYISQDQAKGLLKIPSNYLGQFVEPGQSGSSNPSVVLSDATGEAANAPASRLAKTSAHELYGHALLYIQGKPYQHDSLGPVDKIIIEIEDRTK